MAAQFARTTQSISIEYYSETVDFTDAQKAKIERRLQKLSGGHRDIAGAFVAVHVVSGANRHQEYRARVVLYRRPSNVAASSTAGSISLAVQDALDAVARMTREQRERMRERSRSRRAAAP